MTEKAAKLPPQLMMVPIDKIVPAEWNFKEDDEEKARKLAENIRRNGQIKNCNVRELGDGRYEMIDGNHRLIAFKQLGIKWVLAYNHGPISKEEAIRIAHEVTEYFKIDPLKQAEALSFVLDSGIELEDLAETLPWTPEELSDVVNLLDFDWQQFEEEAQAPEEEITLTFVIPDKESKEKILAQINRIIDLCGFESTRKGRGKALLRMAVAVSKLEDKLLA